VKGTNSYLLFKLAFEAINAKSGHIKETSRKSICTAPLFPQAFAAAKNRIRQMELSDVIEEAAFLSMSTP
jgi:hypothetical protein